MGAPTDAIRRRTTDIGWAGGGLGGRLLAGVAVYELAELAKDAFPRGRPGAVLAEAHLRGVPPGQQGFPSGHAAVSAALAFILFAYLPGRGAGCRWSSP